MRPRLLLLTLFYLSGVSVASAEGDTLPAQTAPPKATGDSPSILFIGNSFTFAAGSPVRFFHTETVTDLNNDGQGGVPALFQAFAGETGHNFTVSLETSPGKNLQYHLKNKLQVINKSWDYVVMQGYSTLDYDKPGDPTELIRSTKELAQLLRRNNPKVDIRLIATWSRADQTYKETGHWYGQPIEKMALDVRAGYNRAAGAAGPSIHGVIPVGEAWNRAMKSGVADANPYDGINPGQLDLWTSDNYHASSYGYYLDALMIFGDITGFDPRSLGRDERAAHELGFTPEQTTALQQVASDELHARDQGSPPPSIRR